MKIFDRNYIRLKVRSFLLSLMKFFVVKIPLFYKILYFLPSKKVIYFDEGLTKKHTKIASAFSLLFVLIARFSISKDNISKQVFYKSTFANFNLNLNVNEYTQCSYYFHEPNNDLIELIKLGGDVFIDIGANVGFFTIIAAHKFNSVLSFEPTPISLIHLRNNIKLNKIRNIEIFEYALSEKPGRLNFYVNPLNSGGNSLNNFSSSMIEKSSRNDWTSFNVEVKTLDSLIFDKKIAINSLDLIKIDIEGHEVPALNGSLNTISKYQPLIYAEVGRSKGQIDKILEILPKYYSPFYISQFEIIEFKKGLVPMDILFVPNEKLDIVRNKIKQSL
jgi:FkbM family methyltransferase